MVWQVGAARWPGRFVVVGFLVLIGMALAGCTGSGGGQLGAPVPGFPAGQFLGGANFGFNFTCEIKGKKAVIRGQLQYHDKAPSTIGVQQFPAIAVHGVVDAIVMDVPTCQAAAEAFPGSALFQGTYRPQTMNPAVPDKAEQGRFTVQVFDQGEPGSPKSEITGDGFAIELVGGTYGGYTRAGYIEGGNVQVR